MLVKFKWSSLMELITHCQNAPVINPGIMHRVYSQFWLKNAKPGIDGKVKEEEVDLAKVKPYLTLTKQVGLYFSSPGFPVLKDDPNSAGFKPKVVYAEGMESYTDAYYELEAEVGDDPMEESLEVDWLLEGKKPGAEYLILELDEDSIKLG